MAQLALVVLELDFYVLERAGTWAALNDTAELDELERDRPDRCGHLVRQVKEQCPPTETTLLLCIERSHALRVTA
ncbi:MAG: hypothetical protein ACXVHB_28970 [Solirubrobacteraceae bacterium]